MPHCGTRSFTTLATNGSFITTNTAMMSGPRLIPRPTRRSRLALNCRRILHPSKRIASFVAHPGRFQLASAGRVSHLPKPVLHVHAQALERDFFRMVREE